MPKIKVKGQTVQTGKCPQTNGLTLPNIIAPATQSIKILSSHWLIAVLHELNIFGHLHRTRMTRT